MVKLLAFQQSLVSHDPSEIILICWFGAQLLLSSVIIPKYWVLIMS